MREIEFRGLNAGGEWVYGSYVSYYEGHHEIHCKIDPEDDFNNHPVNDGTVGQYTGLRHYKLAFGTDAQQSSKKVFEGDSFFVDGIGECFVEINHFYGVCFVDKDGYKHSVIDVMAENDAIKANGNIHETR